MAGTAATQVDLDRNRVNPARVLWAGPLTLLMSLIAVMAIRLISLNLLMPDPDFQPLGLEPPILDTVLFGGAAIFVFFRMCSYHPNPIARYRSLAWKVLILSFIPDVLVALRHSWGGGWPEAVALMTMHVVVWALCVMLLPALARQRQALRT